MFVCVSFSIQIQTAGRVGMKFGTEVVLEGEESCGGFDPPTPGYGPKSGKTWAPCPSGAMVTHYEREFIKSKLYDMSLIANW